jgi:hypothetical protein
MAKTREQRTKEISIPARFTPRFFDVLDGRCGVVKEIHKRYKRLKADTNANNYQKDLLCQRAVFIAIQLETMECVAAQTGEQDPGVYTQMVNTLMGLLKTLGIESKAANVVNLKAYVDEKRAK